MDTDHGLKDRNDGCNASERVPSGPGFQRLVCIGKSAVVGMAKVSRRQCCHGRIVQSGVLVTILEEVMSRTAQAFLGGDPHLRQMNFAYMKPIENTDTLKAEGKVLKGGDQGLVTIEGVLTNDKREVAARSTSEWLIAQAEGTWAP